MIEHYSPATIQLAGRKASEADPRPGIRFVGAAVVCPIAEVCLTASLL